MAEKIILKRSSILGKRPLEYNLDPGEVGLNTNSEDPGAFFEVTDGNVVKIGPASVSYNAPVDSPEKGESWFDLGLGVLKIGSLDEARKVWRSIAAPFLGGGGTCVFVAPEFAFSTDSIYNDGQALPYQTVNRAILELSKLYIKRVLSGFSTTSESNRYTLFLAPSVTTANNDLGVSVEDFSVDFSDKTQDVTIRELVEFNPVDGGIIVPFGISIQGMDLKKSLVCPTHVPRYRNPALPAGLRGTNQPITAIFKCSGNTYLSNFSVTDKVSRSAVVEVVEKSTHALFRSERPHGFKLNDAVQLTFSSQINQSTGTLTPGRYFCVPYDTFSFFLSTEVQDSEEGGPYVSIFDVPDTSTVVGPKFFTSLTLNSAHRLRLLTNASRSEIADYFTKVQKSFPDFFGGKITEGELLVNKGDYEIVGPTSAPYPDNETSNTVSNSSLYANQVNLRSEYGMCWGDFDGSLVEGFKSVIANACTAVSIQNDPRVYEIYTTLNEQQKWWNLCEAAFLSLPVEERPENMTLVPRAAQLDLLNLTPINNIRYYYNTLLSESGDSIGLVDINNDFRHFGFRVRNGAYAQLQSIYTVGAAIGVWSLNGGICNLTNSTTNFGSISFKAEGFLGINSIGGATDNSKGFVIEGIQRPLSLTKFQVEGPENRNILSLGSKITNAYTDPTNSAIQILELATPFIPSHILPYSLKPGSAIWVESRDCIYRGFFAVDGGPTLVTNVEDPCIAVKLRLRQYDSTIPNDPAIVSTLGIPYIRRFADPRTDTNRGYSLYLKSTYPTSVAPQVGSVLRLNQTSQQLGTNSLKPNVQFDPGSSGGWGRVFTVDAVETGSLGGSPQFNYAIADTNQDLNYYVTVTATDFSRPWVQGKEFKMPSGYYTTHKNRNWYVAENNLWEYMYYGEDINMDSEMGPYSLAPTQPYSPFVDSSVLDKQESVSLAYQGAYAQDPYISDYLDGSTYMRGATIPYPVYPASNYYDDDDGSADLGLCLKTSEIPTSVTFVSKESEVVQTEQLPLMKTPSLSARRYRPAIIEFSVLSPNIVPNPKQKVSVLLLSDGTDYEYVRVVYVNGATIRAIRLNPNNSAYPSTVTSPPGLDWAVGTSVTVCEANSIPESSLYDPDWSLTKSSVLRFFEIMGCPPADMMPFLEPKYWGERFLPIQNLSNILQDQGYAISVDKWPLEFNQPSTVIANTHTWAYTGYYNYSRGLLKYQTTDITKKLAADFQASTTWGGRLTVTGINDKGEIIQFGPQRQALTANYYTFSSPAERTNTPSSQPDEIYVEYPSQVSVYSVDDISSQFDGNTNEFFLTKGGLPIPTSQLSDISTLVVLGAVVQKPQVDYTIVDNIITFVSNIPANTKADIRVITSADSERTLTVVPFVLNQTPNNNLTVFTASPGYGYSGNIENLEIDANNTFVIIGGVEQIPYTTNGETSSPWSYIIDKIDNNTIQITFNDPLPAGVSVDIRSYCTSSFWASQSVFPVSVYSLDPLSSQFDGSTSSFVLTFEGNPVNPLTVTQDNLILSLGGSIQIPGEAYTVQDGVITFLGVSEAPQLNTTTNLRLITNSEFISCQVNGRNGSSFMRWGPDLVLKISQELGIS